MAHGVPDKPGPDFFKNEKANDAACGVTIVLGFFFKKPATIFQSLSTEIA